MQIQYSGNFLECLKATIMKTPSNASITVSDSQLLSPGKASSNWLGCIQLSCWLKGSYRKFQRTHDSATTDSRDSLRRTIPHNSLTMEKLDWYLHGAFTPVFQSLWCGKVLSLQASKRETQTPTKPLTYNQSVLPAKYIRTMVSQNLWEQPTGV